MGTQDAVPAGRLCGDPLPPVPDCIPAPRFPLTVQIVGSVKIAALGDAWARSSRWVKWRWECRGAEPWMLKSGMLFIIVMPRPPLGPGF